MAARAATIASIALLSSMVVAPEVEEVDEESEEVEEPGAESDPVELGVEEAVGVASADEDGDELD